MITTTCRYHLLRRLPHRRNGGAGYFLIKGLVCGADHLFLDCRRHALDHTHSPSPSSPPITRRATSHGLALPHTSTNIQSATITAETTSALTSLSSRNSGRPDNKIAAISATRSSRNHAISSPTSLGPLPDLAPLP